MDDSLALRDLLGPDRTKLIAGEVEAEKLTRSERNTLERAGCRFLTTLDELADELMAACAYIGFDSGPTHLAAQLGLPTFAMFGPTDPAIWGPIGPRVTIVAPETPRIDMMWLTPERVAEIVNEHASDQRNV